MKNLQLEQPTLFGVLNSTDCVHQFQEQTLHDVRLTTIKQNNNNYPLVRYDQDYINNTKLVYGYGCEREQISRK